jgi:hypothetical protein
MNLSHSTTFLSPAGVRAASPGLPEKVSQFLEVDVELLEGRPEVLVEYRGQAFAPDLVAKG